eukprot:Nitzschia sp. Nitz4//scaffold3_size479765//400515//402165//NITZ4_000172-RA/size479765-augustus-gene-1.624-mRNA-1//-1//CDS//3329550974//2217//frame0
MSRKAPARLQCSLVLVLLLGSPQDVGCSAMEDAVIDARGQVQMNGRSQNYGVDCSWPMHREHVLGFDRNNGERNPLGQDQRQLLYKEYMQGCVGDDEEYFEECKRYELDRIDMNLLQPTASQNYTNAGFAKMKAPLGVKEMLQEFFEENRERHVREELWERSNTYLNHWQVPTGMLDISHPVVGLSNQQRAVLIQEVQSVLEAWTQQSLVFTSIYGIRVYFEDSILAPHVDRIPLVTSAIINVAQDVEEDWVLEVIGHDGVAHNVTMLPGDMVLYEGHSIIHGRPFPLKGQFFANVFVHFEPLGHSQRHSIKHGEDSKEQRIQSEREEVSSRHDDAARIAYERAFANKKKLKEETSKQLEHENTSTKHPPAPSMPPYVHPNMEAQWTQNIEYEKEAKVSPKALQSAFGTVNPHFAAADGMLDVLKEIATTNRDQLFQADRNGWRPLHEAARSGKAEVVKYLLDQGAQVNERTNQGEGGTPLWWAEKKPRENARAIAILKEHGGLALQPKVLDKKKGNVKEIKS